MSHPVFRQAYRCPPPPKRVPVNVVVADIIAPDGTAREIVVRTCHTAPLQTKLRWEVKSE